MRRKESIDCYDHILRLYEIYLMGSDRKEKIRVICRAIIKIMQVFKQSKNKEVLANSLILVLELFLDIPPDIYNDRGIDVSWMAKADKERKMFNYLKAEVL